MAPVTFSRTEAPPASATLAWIISTQSLDWPFCNFDPHSCWWSQTMGSFCFVWNLETLGVCRTTPESSVSLSSSEQPARPWLLPNTSLPATDVFELNPIWSLIYTSALKLHSRWNQTVFGCSDWTREAREKTRCLKTRKSEMLVLQPSVFPILSFLKHPVLYLKIIHRFSDTHLHTHVHLNKNGTFIHTCVTANIHLNISCQKPLKAESALVQ